MRIHMVLGRREGTAFAAGLALALLAPVALAQQAVVQIGNGAANGTTYLNATNIAETLSFTNVNVTATSQIQFVDPVNLGFSSTFGPAVFDLFTNAPVTSIENNIQFNSAGQSEGYGLSSAVLNLSGSFVDYSTGALIGASQLSGNATTVNVLSNAASLQQALDFTQTASGQATINAGFGTASSLTFNSDAKMLLSGGVLSGTIAMSDPSASLVLNGSNFELNTGSGFHPVGGPITATSGELQGVLNSGNSFTVDFTQNAPGQISVVPLPAAGWLLLSGLVALGAAMRKRRSIPA